MSKLIKKVVSALAIIAICCTVFSAQALAASVDPSIVPSIAPYALVNNTIFVEPGTIAQELGLSYVANNPGVNFEQQGYPGERFLSITTDWQSKLRTGNFLYVHYFFKTGVIHSDYYYIAVRGDINCDGNVDIADISVVNDYLLGNKYVPPEKLIAADVNLNGVVDIYDLLAIQTYVITGQWNL